MRLCLAIFLMLIPVQVGAMQPLFLGATTDGSAADDCSGTVTFSAHFENNDDITQGGPPLMDALMVTQRARKPTPPTATPKPLTGRILYS